MKTTITIKGTEVTAKLWEKGGRRRLYLTDSARDYGFIDLVAYKYAPGVHDVPGGWEAALEAWKVATDPNYIPAPTPEPEPTPVQDPEALALNARWLAASEAMLETGAAYQDALTRAKGTAWKALSFAWDMRVEFMVPELKEQTVQRYRQALHAKMRAIVAASEFNAATKACGEYASR